MNGKASGGNHGSGNSWPVASWVWPCWLLFALSQSCLCHVCRSNYVCNWFVVLQVLPVLCMHCYHSVILNTFRPNPSKESSLNLHLINVPICCWCGKSPTLLVRTKHHPWRCSSKERSRLVLYLAFDMFQCMFMSPSYLSLLSFPRPSSQTVRLQTVWRRWSRWQAECEVTSEMDGTRNAAAEVMSYQYTHWCVVSLWIAKCSTHIQTHILVEWHASWCLTSSGSHHHQGKSVPWVGISICIESNLYKLHCSWDLLHDINLRLWCTSDEINEWKG